MFGHSFRYYDEIESTNAEAKSLAVNGAPEGTVVIAESQTAGRGRLGRRWTSPAGKGLLFSVRAAARPAHGRRAPADARRRHGRRRGHREAGPAPVAIKWPNDLFVADRKVGGILLEVAGEQDEVDWVVVGIGVNVNTEYSELPVALRRTATSLKMAGGEPVDRSELLARLLLSLETQLPGGAPPRVRAGADRFRERDYLKAKTVSVQTRRGRWSARPHGIDDRGALLVELPHRHVRRFHSGDVTLHQ